MCAIMGFSKKTYTKEELLPFFDRTRSRGPDMSQILETPSGWLCFHRLAIMGLTEAGMQPFELDGDYVVCNGEIYGFRPLKRQLTEKGYSFRSGSDCEILLPLYREYGLEMFAKLDAEFALIIYDSKRDELIAARDPIGIRPLYYGYDRSGAIVFASEPKNLVGLCKGIRPFPPGHYYADGKFVRYADLTTVTQYSPDDLETVCRNIRNKLIAAVDKRLDADLDLCLEMRDRDSAFSSVDFYCISSKKCVWQALFPAVASSLPYSACCSAVCSDLRISLTQCG